ncbi:MAG: hypothetical protein PHF86_08285 [Candidatus Nanoarchaeia archaeon]|nr:hypothetical protein [Candidatus Nanoarchaeia archaeon]
MNNIKIDLFKLHDPEKDNSLRKCIVAKGLNLNEKIKVLISELKSKGWRTTDLINYFMKKYNLSSSSVQRLLFDYKIWYPLFFIEDLLILNNKLEDKYIFQENIEFLKVTQPPVKIYKVPKILTLDLCKIAGAHAADGTVRNNYISITDRDKSNIEVLVSWIYNQFNIKYSIIKISENEYGIKFNSKIISRFLTKIFEFPNGFKTYNFKEPKIIKYSSYEFRKAYTIGAIIFEGGVGIIPQLQFSVTNKLFRDSIYEVLSKSLPEETIVINKTTNNLWRLWTKCKTKKEYQILMSFFEERTEKWYKLNDFINGFNSRAKNINSAIQILSQIYPKKGSKYSLLGIFFIIKELKSSSRNEIVNKFYQINHLNFGDKIWTHSLMNYLNILKRCNIIKVEKGRFGKKKSFGTIIREVYNFNENIEEWKLPYRPWLNKLYQKNLFNLV